MAGLGAAQGALSAPSSPAPHLWVSGAMLKRSLLCLPKMDTHPLQASTPCSSGLRALERGEEVDEVGLKYSPAGLAAHRPCHHPHSCRGNNAMAAEGNSASIFSACLGRGATGTPTGKGPAGPSSLGQLQQGFCQETPLFPTPTRGPDPTGTKG